MGKIHLLEDAVINKIAAGEVVERPASVLKELVENAIDAQATEIRVELEEGGRKRIVVSDNGSGMGDEDAGLALVRHATSKITIIDDLYHVSSMGFRGEALASIASVSRFTLMTRQHDAQTGTKISCDGPENLRQKPWNGGPGTTMVVESLFFNVPVREKFLKAPGTEFAYCLEYLQAVALARPEISFVLTHNGREQFSLPAVCGREQIGAVVLGEEAIRQRARSLFGEEICHELLYLSEESQYGHIEALISPPGVEKPTGKQITTFVNRRLVKDKAVRFGIMRGYHSHLLKGKFPRAIVFLSIDPTLFDVNVHPSKEELRFQYTGEVQNLISMGIRNRLRQGDWVKPEADSVSRPAGVGSTFNDLPPQRVFLGAAYAEPRSTHELAKGEYRGASAGSLANASEPSLKASRYSARSFSGQTSEDAKRPASLWQESTTMPPVRDLLMDRIDWTEARFIGSFAACYLLVEVHDGLLVVDQHAFHERIIFERLMRDRSILKQVQPLLVPECVELSAVEVARLRDRQGALTGIGFKTSILSDTMVEVNAIPAILAGKDVTKVLIELAGAEQHTVNDGTLHDLSTLAVATIACHSAVRSGEDLEERDFRLLVNEAQSVDFYHNCPHGRRVFRWFNKSQITGWFDRT